MKKFFSIIFGIVIFICLFALTIVLNISNTFKESNIRKINNGMDYTELVGLMGVKNKSSDFNSLYGKLLDNKFTSMQISSLYNSEYVKKIVTRIEVDNINYLLYNKHYKSMTTDDIGFDFKLENIKDFKGNDISSDVNSKVNKIIDQSFALMEDSVKEDIDSIPANYLKIIRFMFTNNFKIIMICIIAINSVLLIIINRAKTIPYIFVPSTIVGIAELLIVFFLDSLLYKTLSSSLYLILHPFADSFTNKLLITSLVIMCISIFYLAISDKIDSKTKVILRKKIKSKKVD